MAELSAMYGTRLFDRPEHADVKRTLLEFVGRPGPLGLEIGFDHGMCVLDRARSFPAVRQLGVELRQARVESAAGHAPDNCLLLRMDGRTLVSALLPDASVDCLYILFPTPPSSPKRALLTPMFADSVERVLRPGGCLWFATDVSGLADAVDELFRWPPSPAPLLGSQLSRRERICRRDELPIFRRCLARPASFAR